MKPLLGFLFLILLCAFCLTIVFGDPKDLFKPCANQVDKNGDE